MRVVITGGAGFLGSRLARKILKRGTLIGADGAQHAVRELVLFDIAPAAGFTDPQGARVGLGALLVGYFEGTEFVFAGKVGTGFDTKRLMELRARLDADAVEETPFTKATGLPRLRQHWVRPRIVVHVAFIEWTGKGKLRHSRLLAVRTDKQPADVVRVREASPSP